MKFRLIRRAQTYEVRHRARRSSISIITRCRKGAQERSRLVGCSRLVGRGYGAQPCEQLVSNSFNSIIAEFL